MATKFCLLYCLIVGPTSLLQVGGGGGGGVKHFSKTFSIFYMLNSKNRIFNPYFSIGTCPMRKPVLWVSRVLNLFSGHFYGQSFIKTV